MPSAQLPRLLIYKEDISDMSDGFLFEGHAPYASSLVPADVYSLPYARDIELANMPYEEGIPLNQLVLPVEMFCERT